MNYLTTYGWVLVFGTFFVAVAVCGLIEWWEDR